MIADSPSPETPVLWVQDPDLDVWHGGALEVLQGFERASIDSVVTSPPYDDTRPDSDGIPPEQWLPIFTELARVVKGGMVFNVGRYWRDGIEQLWWNKIIDAANQAGWQHWDTGLWEKPNSNPIRGRLFTDSHEYLFCFGRKGVRFNEDAIRTEYAESSIPRMNRKWINNKGVKGEGDGTLQHGREINELGARGTSVFTHSVGKEKGNGHPTPMPQELARELVAFTSWEGDLILDPFAGSGNTGLAARHLLRRSVLIEKEQRWCELIAARLGQQSLFGDGSW